MALSRALFVRCSEQTIPPPSRTSLTTIRSSNQNSTLPQSIDCDKWTAAPATYQALVSPPSNSSGLPNVLTNFTDRLEDLHERKLKEVRHLVRRVGKGSLESLVMVDALERLGIAYRFEEEILSLLQEHHMISTYNHNQGSSSTSLYEVTLRFRLLRQEGFDVPADVLEAFKHKYNEDSGGYVFDRKLCNDIVGLMSLYEASHLSMEGEDILDEAADFSRRVLISWLDDNNNVGNGTNGMISSQTLRELVKNTLSNPFHKSLPRFTSKTFQFYFGGPYEWTRALRELAIMETDLVASVNRNEIVEISKWWKDLGLAKELKFARDQPLKWYMWPMAVLTDPRLSQERVDVTKPIAMIYIIDDIFDVCGSLDELTLFAEAMHRWECTEDLPDYMKTCFRTLDGIIYEISLRVYKKHGWDPTNLLRQSWVSLCDAFLVEARWFASCHSPSADEYLKNAVVSTGMDVALLHSFVVLSEGAEDFPVTSSTTAKILRLWDDLGSAKDENQEGHDGSYVEYYMMENPNCSLEGARDHVKEMISDAWKSLNRECLFRQPFSASLAKAALNTARMVPLMYDYDENHRLARIEQYMKSLLLGRSSIV